MKPLLYCFILGVAEVACGANFDLSPIEYHIDCFGNSPNLAQVSSNDIAKIKQNINAYESLLTSVYFSITTNENAQIKSYLDAYENGSIGIQSLNEKALEEGNRELVGYYLMHANDISTKSKLPIARSFAGFGGYSETVKLTTEYLNTYPNDWHGWRMLGSAYFLMDFCNVMDASNKALYAYSNAVKLGDKESLGPLASVALVHGDMDVVKKIIPQLMALKQSSHISKKERLSVISILLIYSIKADQKDVFIKTLKGVNLSEILKDDIIKEDVETGCKKFKDRKIEKICQELTKAEHKDSKSSPSP